ncbi:uncharacterized protein LOC126778602 isoform X2 [Nymphalis io]|uniref:uncharacterized protein LOC126778602 isoform X2 n=1 Tax=Inachis io TaxID=171585 RepID=UPI002166E64D|nr:uncharacterized protein LOC126778602 isoform X2 [Nymphalis io]
MVLVAFCAMTLILCAECTHIFGLDRDFSKLNSDKDVANYVAEILNRLKTFKVAVHPRIRLFYQLLKRGMSDYAHRTSDSLYNPSVYKQPSDNVL